MKELHYSIVLDNPETGESSVLCHGTTLQEAQEVVAALARRHPELRFGVVMTDAWQDFPLTRAAG